MRPSYGHYIAAVIVAFITLVSSTKADEQETTGRLQAVERELNEGRKKKQQIDLKAIELERELLGLQELLITKAAAAQHEEETISHLEGTIYSFQQEERSRQLDLFQRETELAVTLAALERVAYLPPEMMLLNRTSAIDIIRSSWLLSSVVPLLEVKTRILENELGNLQSLRGKITADQVRLIEANRRLSKEQRELDRLLKRKASRQANMLKASQWEQVKLSQLAVEAKDLQALLDRLTRGKYEDRDQDFSLNLLPLKPFSAARGAMPFPVRGKIVSLFGEASEFGRISRGISITSRASAQVIAPHDGRTVFAGSFRSYGQLLIIAHSGGYHTLIAGMGHMEVSVGQWLLAGEPVGRMNDGSGSRPILYIEVRHAGEPVNPLLWLAAREGKVEG